MILKCSKQWFVALVLWLPKVNLQMSMPLFMPPPMPPVPAMPPMMPPMPPMMPPMVPPMFLPPPPPPMPLPGQPPIAFQIVQIQEPKKTNTGKREKVEKTIGIAMPMSFPAPMQFAMPSAPAPPSALPSRPEPMMQRMQPGYPEVEVRRHEIRRPRKRPREIWRDKSYEVAELQDLSSEMTLRKIRKRKRPGRALIKPMFRRNFDPEMNYDDFAKPVLSYISNDGDVKLEKRLSEDEAAELMGEDKLNQKVQIVAEEDGDKKQSVKVLSSFDNKLNNNNFRSEPSDNHRRRQVLLKPGSIQHMLGEGKKELVFKPPLDKKISNLSVSFQIT